MSAKEFLKLFGVLALGFISLMIIVDEFQDVAVHELRHHALTLLSFSVMAFYTLRTMVLFSDDL